MSPRVANDIQTFLIIDDDPIQSNVVKTMLGLCGVNTDNITLAKDGWDGMKKVNDAPAPFSVVVTDWRMPVMDGIEFIEAFRKNPENEKTAVVLVTFFTKDEVREHPQLHVADGVLFKPFKPDGLVDTINAAWEKRCGGQ